VPDGNLNRSNQAMESNRQQSARFDRTSLVASIRRDLQTFFGRRSHRPRSV